MTDKKYTQEEMDASIDEAKFRTHVIDNFKSNKDRFQVVLGKIQDISDQVKDSETRGKEYTNEKISSLNSKIGWIMGVPAGLVSVVAGVKLFEQISKYINLL